MVSDKWLALRYENEILYCKELGEVLSELAEKYKISKDDLNRLMKAIHSFGESMRAFGHAECFEEEDDWEDDHPDYF